MRTVISSNADDVARWLRDDAALVIDVRETDEVDTACVPGAMVMPLSEFNLQDIPAAHDKRVVFLCGEGVRSASAGQQVLDDGWLPESFFVAGGIQGWARAGLPMGVGDCG